MLIIIICVRCNHHFATLTFVLRSAMILAFSAPSTAAFAWERHSTVWRAACCNVARVKKGETCWSCCRAGAQLLMAVQTSARLHSSPAAAKIPITNCQTPPIPRAFPHTHCFCFTLNTIRPSTKSTNEALFENGCAKRQKAISQSEFMVEVCPVLVLVLLPDLPTIILQLTFKTTELQLFWPPRNTKVFWGCSFSFCLCLF